MRSFRVVPVTVVVAALVAATPSSAQDGGGGPSSEQARGAARAPSAPESVTPRIPDRPAEEVGARTPFAVVVLVALAVPGVALALLWVDHGRPRPAALRGPREASLRRRRRPAAVEPASTSQDPPEADEDVPPTAAAADQDAALRPSDPGQRWTAEIEWQAEGGRASFRAVARGGGRQPHVLGASAGFEWPPAGAADVRAMTEAFETLEASLLAAGWAPAESGPRWYAKRFDWTPAAEQGDGRSRDVA